MKRGKIMKIRVNRYLMNQPKTDRFRLVCFSDIHGDSKVLSNIREVLEDLRPDYIAIPGDIVDMSSQDKRKIYEELKRILKIAPIVASLGNHDIEDLVFKKWVSSIDYELIEKLHQLDGFTMIDSTHGIHEIPNSNVVFSAFNPDYDWYNIHKENTDKFYEEFNKVNFRQQLTQDNLNILLSHSPSGFVKNNQLVGDEMSLDIKFFDLILNGHYHGGLMPQFMQNTFRNHVGFITPGPKYQLLAGGSYGIYQNDSTTLLISNGVNKLSESTGILSLFNGLYPADVEVIDFSKNEEKSMVKH
jgi:predicted MPP superfamily phosphohydrolase